MVWLKKGDNFLSGISRAQLKNLYKKEKKVKAKLRLLAALQRKDGKTLDDIAYSLAKPKTTIHDWLKRFEKGNLTRLYDTKQPGKPTKLTKSQIDELDKILDSSPQKQGFPFVLWTTKLVHYLLITRYHVQYTLRQIQNLVKKLGFTLKTPRQQNIKTNKKAQEKFKKELKKKFDIMLNLDSRSSVLTKHISS